MAIDFDLVIAGGSIVGATLACALAETDLRIAIIEPTPRASSQDDQGYDLRVFAITRASQRIFQSLDVWQAMQNQRVSPFRDMHVWDAAGTGVIHFDSAEIGEATLGYIVENRVIQAALLDKVHLSDNISLFCPAELDSYETQGDHVSIRLRSGKVLTAKLLVGADGSHSTVRQQASIATTGWDYDQRAVVATVKPEKFHQETAWQRFLEQGPLAFLPLSEGYCSIVWSTQPDHAEQLLAMEEAEFLLQLEQAIDSRLGKIETTGPRVAFPLRMQYAKQYVKDRIALIGDAAHTIHPLAGQGVNLGLLDAAVLAEVLQQGQDKKRDIGSQVLLRKYERWRKGDNMAMMYVMDGFKRVFGSNVQTVQMIRNLGLSITNAATPVKNQIIIRAMGLEGDLPRIAS